MPRRKYRYTVLCADKHCVFYFFFFLLALTLNLNEEFEILGPGMKLLQPACKYTGFHPALEVVLYGPLQANLVLIAYASSEGSGEPAHPRSLARTFAARSYKQRIKRNLQTESQIPGPSEWLGMRS